MIIAPPSFATRLAMVAVWLVLIFGFLYAPLAGRLLFKERRTLNVLMWPTMLDAQQLAVFEKDTGIKLHITYYESNGELLRKLRLTKGAGYDLIIAADSSIQEFIEQNILQKIDRTKLPFFDQLYPPLLGHYHDPHNEYSIPYYLGVYGLGVDTDYFGGKLPKATWKLIFERHPFKVTMTDDPRRAILLTGFYLFNSIDNLTRGDRMQQIKELLLKQKQWIELYTDIRGEDVLASKSCPVALTISSDLWRMKREYNNLDFIVPYEGSFMVIDSFVMPAASKKQDLVYQLLNFVYQPDIIKYHATKYGFCPPTINVDVAGYGLYCPTPAQIKKLEFFKNVVPKSEIDKVWVAVMAK